MCNEQSSLCMQHAACRTSKAYHRTHSQYCVHAYAVPRYFPFSREVLFHSISIAISPESTTAHCFCFKLTVMRILWLYFTYTFRWPCLSRNGREKQTLTLFYSEWPIVHGCTFGRRLAESAFSSHSDSLISSRYFVEFDYPLNKKTMTTNSTAMTVSQPAVRVRPTMRTKNLESNRRRRFTSCHCSNHNKNK